MSTATNPVAVAGAAGKTMVKRVVQVTWVAAAAALLLLVFIAGQTWGVTTPLEYRGQAVQNLATVLAPLMAIALFIERAVEVVISSWRNEGALHLKALADGATDPVSKVMAQRNLEVYRDQTQTLSFITSVTISAVAAMAGVRAIAPLVVSTAETASGVFSGFDIAVTALLLAGGADGMHQIVTTFTDFLESTKSKMNASPAAAAPATVTQATVTQATVTQSTPVAPPATEDGESGAAG
ncbi:MAG TPA: hypothetical protein VFJ82_21600 [Longimicrobium sp.]|nr:hypothetical protein [Longimicrobium sp.]